MAMLIFEPIISQSQISYKDTKHPFNIVLYHKWDVKNDFAYMLQFFSLIFDGLGSVYYVLLFLKVVGSFITHCKLRHNCVMAGFE